MANVCVRQCSACAGTNPDDVSIICMKKVFFTVHWKCIKALPLSRVLRMTVTSNHATVTCLSHDHYHSYTLRGQHTYTDKDYVYDVGICVAPTTMPGCAVVQTDSLKDTATCIGNLTQFRVAEDGRKPNLMTLDMVLGTGS